MKATFAETNLVSFGLSATIDTAFDGKIPRKRCSFPAFHLSTRLALRRRLSAIVESKEVLRDSALVEKNVNTKSLILGLFIPLVVVAAGIAFYFAMGKATPEAIDTTVSDRAVAIKKLPIVELDEIRAYDPNQTLDLNANGVVVPLREVNLATEVAGRIVEKSDKCRAGNYVAQGDLLFRIDDKDYRLEVERLSAQRQSEYSQIQELEQEISNTSRLIKVAEEDVELQDREIQRLVNLPSGFASATELDTARRNRLTSLNALTTQQNQLELLRTRRTRIELSEKLAATQLEQARVNLERTEIRAPIAGVIVSEEVQKDSFVQRGATLCVLEDTTSAEVACDLRTDQLSAILDQTKQVNATEDVQDATTADVISQSYALPPTPVRIVYKIAGREDIQYEWSGKLNRYEGVGVDIQSRTISVRVLVENPREVHVVNTETGEPVDDRNARMVPTLLRGMFVQAIFQTQPNQAMIMIPKIAVRPGGQVWKFEPDPDAIKLSSPSKPEPEQSGQASDDSNVKFVTAQQEAAAEDVAANDTAGTTATEDDWEIGRVKVLSGIRVVRIVEGDSDKEFWVAPADERLAVGTPVIVTPLAAIMGDGSDVVRTEKETPQ